MVDIEGLMNNYIMSGVSREMAAARVCQDILLRAISLGPMKNNVTIKGGIVIL